LYDSRGQPVDLAARLASGGEGAIYSLPGSGGLVAKVYHKPSPERAEKLSAMVRDASEDLVKVAAWPTGTLHESRYGPVAGFVMPKVAGCEEVHKLYGPAHRRSAFPGADWAFLVHAAMNCAHAFEAVHAKNYVIGDVNQSNILVSPRALVYLIDCDSFQVQSGGRLFRCQVGVAQYTPPELQDGDFRRVVRTPNHDRFGLAVLIFHLLFMGRHPFAGRFLGSGEMLLERAIKEFRFAYAYWARQVQMAAPPFALPLDVLTPDLAGLFDRAFRPGSEAGSGRPTAGEWRSSLAAFQKQLVTCPTDLGHKAPRHLGKCPWCDVMQAGGPNFFVGVAVVEVVFAPDQQMLSRLRAQIDAVPGLSFAYARPRLPTGRGIRPAVSAGDYASTAAAEWATGSLAVGGLALLLGSIWLGTLACFGLPIALVFGVWCLVLVVSSPLRKARGCKQREWRAASEALAGAEADWHDALGRSRCGFDRAKAALAEDLGRLAGLKADYEGERRQLERNKEAILRDQFLQTRFIDGAVANKEIPGVGPGRQVLLESHGVETAYDIEEARVRAIRGFGDVLVGNLLAWKQRVACEFRFDPGKGVPEAELKALVQRYKQRQDLLRARLERGACELQELSGKATRQLETLRSTIQGCVIDLAQAEADMEALAVKVRSG
jgi:DNA-binding helix-hairpin-helix protein with protein kinase domain